MTIQRKEKILELISKDSSINVKDISIKLSVAEATVRRDLVKLADEGYIHKQYGKITLLMKDCCQGSLNSSGKQLIESTCEQLHDGNVVLINKSSMNVELMKVLDSSEKQVTIVTNSMDVFDIGKKAVNINMILLAGLYNKASKIFSGSMPVSLLSMIRADQFVIYPSGIDFEKGFFVDATEDLTLIKEMANMARKVIVYIDSNCVDENSGVLAGDMNLINTLIMPEALYQKYQTKIDSYNFSIVRV